MCAYLPVYLPDVLCLCLCFCSFLSLSVFFIYMLFMVLVIPDNNIGCFLSKCGPKYFAFLTVFFPCMTDYHHWSVLAFYLVYSLFSSLIFLSGIYAEYFMLALTNLPPISLWCVHLKADKAFFSFYTPFKLLPTLIHCLLTTTLWVRYCYPYWHRKVE